MLEIGLRVNWWVDCCKEVDLLECMDVHGTPTLTGQVTPDTSAQVFSTWLVGVGVPE